mgnify:CR=1 FL=1
MSSQHKDTTSQHNYLTCDCRNMPSYHLKNDVDLVLNKLEFPFCLRSFESSPDSGSEEGDNYDNDNDEDGHRTKFT